LKFVCQLLPFVFSFLKVLMSVGAEKILHIKSLCLTPLPVQVRFKTAECVASLYPSTLTWHKYVLTRHAVCKFWFENISVSWEYIAWKWLHLWIWQLLAWLPGASEVYRI
jgi:hypothetical protein